METRAGEASTLTGYRPKAGDHVLEPYSDSPVQEAMF